MANSISHAALPFPIYNARFSVLVPYLDADGDPTDPTATIDTEVSQDAGAFADATEEVTAPSGSRGMGIITFSALETDCSAMGVWFGCATAKATLMTLYPRNLPILSTGTASAGGATSLTLAAAILYDITGCFLRTTGGTGGGTTANQARRITAYNTSTGVCTVSPAWETNPDNTTTYDVLLPEGVTLGMVQSLIATTPGRTLDVTATGAGGVDWNNVENPTTTINFSGTTIKTATDVAVFIDTEVAAIKAVTDLLPNAGALTTIQSDLDDLQTRIPAALSGGNMKCDLLAINTATAAAARLALSAGVIIPGTVDTTGFAPTTTEFECDDITAAAADFYNGRIIIFTSGALTGQATSITDYSLSGGRGHFTVPALTSAPANDVALIVI